MSLPAREQRILDRIECQLRADDPRLAAELSAFGGRGGPVARLRWAMRGWNCPAVRPAAGRGGQAAARARLVAVVPAAVLLALCTLVLSVAAPRQRVCGPGRAGVPGTLIPVAPVRGMALPGYPAPGTTGPAARWCRARPRTRRVPAARPAAGHGPARWARPRRMVSLRERQAAARPAGPAG